MNPGAVVLVVVGTDTHPFNRLMTWLECWHAGHTDPPHLLVQHGYSRRPDLPGSEVVDFLDHETLQRSLCLATLVVSHGGPATISEARRAGCRPLVVPRDPRRGEHVDDHQLRFTDRLARRAMIRLCRSEQELADALDTGLADPGSYRLDPDPAGAGGADTLGSGADTGEADGRVQAAVRVGRIVEDLVQARRELRSTPRWFSLRRSR